MKNTFTFCFFLSFVIQYAIAQAPLVEWDYSYGGDMDDTGYGIEETEDGGYIVTGSTKSGQNCDHSELNCGDYDIWVLKLDASGILINQNSIRGSGTDRSQVILEVSDGYIVQGHSTSGISCDKNESGNGGYDAWFIKLDAGLNNIVWQNSFGGSGDEISGNALRKTTDGGTIACGYTTTSTNGGRDYYIKKLNTAGNTDWTVVYGGTEDDVCTDIRQTADAGYIAIGYSRSGISGDKTVGCSDCDSAEYWLLRLDSEGSILWQKDYGGSGDDIGGSVLIASNGDFIISGSSSSPISGTKTENKVGGTDFWVLRTDSNGNLLDQNTIGGYKDDDFNISVEGTNGGYLLAGTSNSDAYSNTGNAAIDSNKTENSRGGYDYWVVKVNETLNKVWDKTMGSTSDEFLRGLDATSDGGYVIDGRSNSPAGGEKSDGWCGASVNFDYWTVKLASDISGVIEPALLQPNFTVSPNPADESVRIDFSNLVQPILSVEIYDCFGKCVWMSKEPNVRQFQLSVNSFKSGLYLVQLKTEVGITIQKLVVQ